MTTRTWRSSARRAALGGILGLGAAAAGPAEAATLIQMCPYTITVPDLYVLARDLTCPPGDGITITADNVRLVLGGHTLTGSGSGAGVRAEGTPANPTLEGLRVEHGTVTRFALGIGIEDAPGVRVTNVTATDNGSIGIDVDGSPDARIEANTANGNNEGIVSFGCDRCRIIGNRASGNAQEGILVSGAEGTRIDGNTANGNGQAGIDLDFRGNIGNLVQGNTATGNGTTGIEVGSGSIGNLVQGNTATGNASVDLEDRNLPLACVNTWRGNRFVTDNETGAAFGPGAGCIR